ncbi:hypothetical protein PsorP6_012183 [Peronosclerospora sorghi]|uniref:Uncharacterized protein n=1 Tax=Peronosclerospora sorghi TaxID=230839 RepID=A0ACC0WJP2_9STRA|nr:hypothetical protein PsorP6_012183 [Peronosclerospora sorghi]
MFYATLIEDYEKVITYHMDRGDYGVAIEILRSVETSKIEEIWYKTDQSQSKEVYEAWLEVARLNPTRLIPSIVRHVHQKSAGSTRKTTKSRSVLNMAQSIRMSVC